MRTRFLICLTVVLLLGAAGNVFGQEPTETIRIESDLVDLKVSVLGQPLRTTAQLLAEKDFRVFEDGVQQEIAFFAAADAPFDLVLLLDLSGSSSDKLKMIKRSAKRFVEATRPVDRIAVVTFTDRVALLSNFTLDRTALKRQIDTIKDAFGGTTFWDALAYVLRDVVSQSHGTRRSAVVVMSDGVDNALPDVAGPGSRISFENLMAMLNGSEAIIFPIYLDTEKEIVNSVHIPRAAYALAREQLGQIASTCGTSMYHASKLKDLDDLYGKVINDLSRVYSIGYRPTNRAVDGKWRSVVVELVDLPALAARTRRGYFGKTLAAQ